VTTVRSQCFFGYISSSSLALLLLACTSVSLEQQQQQIRDQKFQFGVLSSEAFLSIWGPPTYQHEALVQFYPLHSGQLVPSFLVPTGEAPADWDSTMVSEVGRFFAYADRGELLGFVSNRLVYRGRVRPEEVHRVGKVWANELKFRTGTEAEFLQRR
jgi:hypothetical protein